MLKNNKDLFSGIYFIVTHSKWENLFNQSTYN